MRFRFLILISCLLTLWASSYVAIRHSLETFTPGDLAFLRYLIASIGFILTALFVGIKRPRLADLGVILLLGLTGFSIYNLLLNFGERTVSAGVASFVINTVPFFTMIIVLMRGEETADSVDWLGIVVAFIGVSIIIMTNESAANFNLNALYILGAAFCQAIYFALQKKLLKQYTPLQLTSYAVWSGTLILFLFSNDPFNALANADSSHVYSIVYLGLFPGMLAYLLVAYALREHKASNISSYLFLIPFVTLFLGWLLLDELPSIGAICGGLLIAIGVFLKVCKPSWKPLKYILSINRKE